MQVGFKIGAFRWMEPARPAIDRNANAVKWENKYLEFNLSKYDSEKAGQRLGLYEQKKPYHEEKP